MKSVKAVFGILSMLIGSVFVGGCDLLDKADDVTFDATFSLPNPFVIDEDLDEPENPYLFSEIVDATTDTEVAKYAGKIKSIKVNRITYRIYDFVADGAVTLTSGSFSIGAFGETPVAVANETNLSLGNTSETDLDFNQEGLNKISDILLDNLEAQVSGTATISDSPVEFKVAVKFYATITANALD